MPRPPTILMAIRQAIRNKGTLWWPTEAIGGAEAPTLDGICERDFFCALGQRRKTCIFG